MKKNNIRWSSQCGQDKFIIEKIFKNKKNGIFVEVGAHDGVYLSNTYSLEEHFFWSGVCVEPSRGSSSIIKRRKKSKVFNVCVSPLEFEGQIVRFRERSSPEISHTIFEDLYSPPHYAKEQEMEEKAFWDRLKKCSTLDSILSEANIGNNIDYISVDTQGSEWLVIKDFPFDKWNVHAFTIANDMYVGGEKEKNRDKVKKLMEKNGYKLKKVFTIHELDKKNWGKDFKDQIIEDLYVKQDG